MKLEELFFKVKREEVFFKDKKIEHYYAVIKEEEKEFVGMKCARNDCMTNREVFDVGKNIYEKLLQVKSEVLTFSMNRENGEMMIFLYGIKLHDYIRGLIDDINNIEIKGSSLFFTVNVTDIEKNNYRLDSEEYLMKRLKEIITKEENLQRIFPNYDIVLVMKNNYDSAGCINNNTMKNPNYYIAIGWGADNDDTKKERKRIITLKLLPLKRNGYGSCEKIAKNFKEALIDFVVDYFIKYQVKIKDQKTLKSIILNILNIQTQPTSVENDEELKENIKDLVSRIENFIENKKELHYSTIIDFIIDKRIVRLTLDGEDNNVNSKYFSELNNVLVDDIDYKHLKSRTEKILKDERKREKYEQECLEDCEKIKEITNCE